MGRIARRLRANWMGDVIDRINDIQASVAKFDKKITDSEDVIRDLLLTVNHKQTLLLDETNERVKNSGTLVLSDTEVLTKIFSGLKMYLDPRDMAITPHLVLDGIWEHRVTIAWRSVIKSHDTVLDVGSNNGYYGALAAQLTDKKKSNVVLFEANPHLIPYIRKTLAVNWLNEQSVLENLAISDKAETLTLNILKDYVGSSSVLPIEHTAEYMGGKMYLEKAESVKVKAVSIDEYCKEHGIKTIDAIMMDIEGFEDTAYAGMRNMVQASPNLTFFLEFTKESYADSKKFYELMLKDFGHVYVIDEEGYMVKPKDMSYETVIGDSDDWVMPIFSKNAKLANR